MEKLSNQEKEAMLALWRIGKGTARQILATHEEPLPHYNTLRSTLENLRRKAYLESTAIGNTNEYLPIIKSAAYKKHFMSEFVKNHFQNSYKELVSFCAQTKKLSESDITEILDIIKNKKTR